MRKLFLSLVLFVCISAAFAQAPVGDGNTQINVGAGISNHGIPLYIGFDHGVHPDVSLGAEVSFRSFGNNNYNHSGIGISGNANYHFDRILSIPSKWNFYAGASIGFYIWNYDDKYEGSKNSGLGLEAQIGGRYFFTNKFGINLEFGGGNNFSGGKIGATFKL